MNARAPLIVLGAIGAGIVVAFLACSGPTGTGGVGGTGGAGSGGAADAGMGGGSAGAAGAGGTQYSCDKPWPDAVPTDWIELPWSCDCRFFYAPEPATQVAPIEWEVCPPVAWASTCRKMKVDWTTGTTPMPFVAFVDQANPTPILVFRRNQGEATDPRWYLDISAEIDGVVTGAVIRPRSTNEVGFPGCFALAATKSQDWVLLDVDGHDAESKTTSDQRGLIAWRTDGSRPPSILEHTDEGGVDDWVGSTSFLIHRFIGSAYATPWGQDTFTLVASSQNDSEGMSLGNVVPFGDVILTTVNNPQHPGINIWDAASGLRPLRKFPGDPTKGAGSPGTDGVDLVWVEGEGKQPNASTFDVQSYMAAPFVNDPVALQPKRLRSRPGGTGLDGFPLITGCGYMADESYKMRLVRISDGTLWELGDDTYKVLRPIGITCDDIFAWGFVAGVAAIYRIPLAALGPGMPAD